MALTIEAKLRAARANNNALKEEIAGLKIYINMLYKKLGKSPKFELTSQQPAEPDVCECGRNHEIEVEADGKLDWCPNCFKRTV